MSGIYECGGLFGNLWHCCGKLRNSWLFMSKDIIWVSTSRSAGNLRNEFDPLFKPVQCTHCTLRKVVREEMDFIGIQVHIGWRAVTSERNP